MSQPPAGDHVHRIAQVLAGSVAPGWRHVRAELRAAGQHVEVDVVVTGPDGFTHPVRPHPEVVRLLGQVRAAMYQPGRGTWLAGEVEVDPAGGVRTRFVLDEEPRWRVVPPPVGFQDELRLFPRADHNVPPWWRKRVEPAVRSPRVWDGLGTDGKPVPRPPVPAAERSLVLAYLEDAPAVLAARSHDKDVYDPEREPAVPLVFRTDGLWVWPGAVPYYLREHDLAPDPELLAHIRARGFVLAEVDETARDRALAVVTAPSTVQ
ncbi:hypothetical protein [Actinokineospora enzanensis]|uniref:hypothetical protein n=1 Tax=Actinokineospora enzanensis TaxID=155975 RepID=UPI0004762049|nr:hypothetical protein [Actinokineospora enzanensis]